MSSVASNSSGSFKERSGDGGDGGYAIFAEVFAGFRHIHFGAADEREHGISQARELTGSRAHGDLARLNAAMTLADAERPDEIGRRAVTGRNRRRRRMLFSSSGWLPLTAKR